jgi:hypothetical protein
MKRFELEKTETEREDIRIVNEATDALRERYGLPPREVSEKNIHILRDAPESRKEVGHEAAHGRFSENAQAIMSIEQPTRARFLHSVFHETVHFKSYTSFDIDVAGPKTLGGRRLGLSAREGGSRVFVPLNEAVTEELTKRFIRGQEDRLKDEADIRNLQKARSEYPAGDVEDIFSVEVSGRTVEGGTKLALTGFGYRTERKALNLLLDKLAERNPKAYMKREDWFDEFASAMFNGHLLQLARDIEETFGKGRFRELGEQKTGEELLKFVESL